MLLKSNIKIRAQSKKVGDFLIDLSQVRQYSPGVEMIETIEAHRKQNKAYP